jgi:hypothetical protein
MSVATGEGVTTVKLDEKGSRLAKCVQERERLAAIVSDLAALDPLSESKFGVSFCMFCEASENIEEDHIESCVWRRAKELQP